MRIVASIHAPSRRPCGPANSIANTVGLPLRHCQQAEGQSGINEALMSDCSWKVWHQTTRDDNNLLPGRVNPSEERRSIPDSFPRGCFSALFGAQTATSSYSELQSGLTFGSQPSEMDHVGRMVIAYSTKFLLL
ncbi:hypothetical protein PtA15_5A316 [Puccinia triticina]|uniref:Uncharacterized protein n=1 Tax=Puccinia triticina TaxID=208348 RepID=A0ABY7CHQ6_9BASI|nr:uncharacterized protein PtA15_5A316 [Puccinia triticina]WAQ84743.1 hypothetical protein PtA15_5A316 [Puccinia triticina]